MSNLIHYAAYGCISAFVGTLFYANLPIRYTIGEGVVPTVKYLAATNLQKITSEKDVLTAPTIKAGKLFEDESPLLFMAVRRPGCTLCRHEAKKLGEISKELEQAGVRSIAVLHEYNGADQFKPYFKGDLYYDAEKRFFGPQQRWMPFYIGFLRASTYFHGGLARSAGVPGDAEGEGRLLGGVYLINKDDMVYAHLEKDWGDHADTKDILEAVKSL